MTRKTRRPRKVVKKLGLYNPWGDADHPAHKPQCEYLTRDRTKPGITLTHFIGGRGSSKSASGMLLLQDAVFRTHPGARGFWSEPRFSDIEKIFMVHLRDICPYEGELWVARAKKNAHWIEWANGSVTDLLSRNVDNPKKKVNVGPNYSYGFVDEAALGFNITNFNDLMNSVRVKGKGPRFIDCLTTPQPNSYRLLYQDHPETVIRSSSYDNPYLDPADIDAMKEFMSPEYIQQEIYGQDVVGSGRIWTNFVEKQWPEGNLIDVGWNPSKPWWLFCDLGSSQGSYQIMQQVEGLVDPRTGYSYNSPVDVIVGEVLANNMIFSSVLHLIDEKYAKERAAVVGGDGKPVLVIVGHDVATRGNDGNAAGLALRQRGWKYKTPTGLLMDKSVQQQILASRLLNGRGERRLLVSAKLRRHEHEISPGKPKHRGIIEMFRNDQYPPVESSAVFIKDKKTKGTSGIEDDRDCLLYGESVLHAPSWVMVDPDILM